MAKSSISLCMIVKNEETDLADCLESVENVVDEIIIVDTGSTDRTIEIARRYHTKIFEIPWPGDFSTARNISLEKASKDWIFIMDADEKLDPASAILMKGLLSEKSAGGLRFIQRNIAPAGDLVRYYDIPTTRMWPNSPVIRYEGLIHESVVESILRAGSVIENSSLVIWHSGYARSSVQGGNFRGERNLEILKVMLSKDPQDSYLHYQLGITYKNLGNNKKARQYLKKVLEMDIHELTSEIMGEILMKLAQIELAENQNKDCIQFAEASLRYTPDNVTSLYLAALGHMSLGLVDKAYPYFLKIRQAPPNLLNDIDNLDTIISYCQKELEIRK